ncbi:MAG TPA: hypothetical protein EYN69_00895 [Flavobacteriales bacterium]|nr:hypothetical protein [Flavobacteriales bacterium]
MRISINSLLLLAFLEGAAVMTVELLAARMLTPYFGAGLQTWGAVIGITLTSLGLGYYLGGRLSEKFQTKEFIYWTILLASIFIIMMPSNAKKLIASLIDVERMMALLIAVPLLLVPVLALLGMIPVLIIQRLTEETDDSGNTTGQVYTISTIGGIVGTYLMGFVIIPNYGLTVPAIITGLVCGAISMILLLSKGKMIAASYLVVILFSLLSMRQEKTRSAIKVLYQSEGLMGQLMVVDMKYNQGYERALFVNRMGQTIVDMRTGKSKWSYVDYLTSVASKLPEGAEVLLLGLGGGTTANQLSSILNLNVTTVDLDARMPHLAAKYFAMDNKVNVVIDDARHYIESCDAKYDLVIFDLYKGEVIPAQALTIECFTKVKDLLNESGFLVISFNGFLDGDIGRAGRSVYKTLVSAGLKTELMPTYEEPKYRNCIFIASEEKMEYTDLRFNLQGAEGDLDITSLFMDPASLDFDDAVVFTDDQPLLEHYNASAAAAWRNEYNSSFTPFFISQGIELFE